MKLTFNLDWNDTHFDWSQTTALDLGAVTSASADCKRIKLKSGGRDAAQPAPSTNQIRTQTRAQSFWTGASLMR